MVCLTVGFAYCVAARPAAAAVGKSAARDGAVDAAGLGCAVPCVFEVGGGAAIVTGCCLRPAGVFGLAARGGVAAAN